MGSLCCVAARPHGSTVAASGEWSIGRSEPFWRTNSSFSPPLSARWDYQFQGEGLSPPSRSNGENEDGLAGRHGSLSSSSFSSNSKGSRSWGRGESLGGGDHVFSPSDGAVSYVSSPSDSLRNHQLLLPPYTRGLAIEEHLREPGAPEYLTLPRFLEGALGLSSYAGSTSSRSDGSEYEPTPTFHGSAHRFSSRCSFMSKAIHPLSFPEQTTEGEEAYCSFGTTNFNDSRSTRAFTKPQSLENESSTRRGSVQWSSASSIDYTDVCEPLDPETRSTSCSPMHEGFKCGLCERLLSRRSPWGSRKIVRNGDMPIISVLSCWHVYHAECLERATLKTHKHDPPCPQCNKSDENALEQWAVCRLRHGHSRLRSPGGEGSSRIWSCAQAGDCVEGALHAPRQSRMMLLSRNRLKRQLSLKGNLVKERAEGLRKSGHSPQEVFQGHIAGGNEAVGCQSISTPESKKAVTLS